MSLIMGWLNPEQVMISMVEVWSIQACGENDSRVYIMFMYRRGMPLCIKLRLSVSYRAHSGPENS